MSKRVFIGVGHGGIDPGAVGYVEEADANLVIALELKKQLEAAGLIVGISRVRDENDDINEEIREANAFKPDLAVEVHNNAGRGDGFEVYIGNNSYYAESLSAAKEIEAEVKATGQYSRGVKTGTFGWVRLINAPAVLTEGFFVDNRADAVDFDTVAEQQALGRAYARAVLKYFGISAGTGNASTAKPSGTTTSTTNNKKPSGANAAVQSGKPEPARSGPNKVYAKKYTVTADDGLNMRLGAGVNKGIIKTLEKGEKVTCYGYYTVNGSTIWLYVQDKTGQCGFCSKAYLK